MSYRVTVRNLTNPSKNLLVRKSHRSLGCSVIPKDSRECTLVFATEDEFRECQHFQDLLREGLVAIVPPEAGLEPPHVGTRKLRIPE